MKNDESIIKAFAGYVKSGFFNSGMRLLLRDVLNLLLRQRREIEMLKFKSLQTEERIKTAKEVKNEAIKEFAERLKAEYADFDELHEEIRYDNLIFAIDDLVKEMTEASE